MRIRPGRGRSLAGGIGILLVTFVGFVMLMSFGGSMGTMPPGMGMGPSMGLFAVIWLVVGLIGAGVAFYNAFNPRGMALYEIEMDSREERRLEGPTGSEAGTFCPSCGKPVAPDSRFCRHCGEPLA